MPKIQMTLSAGNVIIETLPQIAPAHVMRITELVSSGFYDGLTFHRVIDGFMAQTGCPNGDGTGRSGVSVPAEFSNIPFKRGTVGMARAMDINYADCQFFICLADCDFLNGKYTVWGQVISGMEYIDKIKRGDEFDNGRVTAPDKIIKMQIID